MNKFSLIYEVYSCICTVVFEKQTNYAPEGRKQMFALKYSDRKYVKRFKHFNYD